MAAQLQIPDFKAPDLSAIGDAGTLMQAGRNAAAKQRNEDRKLSADLARQQYEQQHQLDREQHDDAVAASQQLLPGSALMRAAQNSTALGNAVGAPYGIKLDENTPDAAPAVDAQPAPPSAAIAQFLQSGGVPASANADMLNAPVGGPGGVDAVSGGSPTPVAADPAPAAAPAGPPDPQDVTAAAPEAALNAPDAPDAFNVDAELAAREPAKTRHVYATVNGQRFEIPQQGETKPFNEPEYNDLYNRRIASGETPEKAATEVETMRRTDIGEGGKNHRFDASLGQKQATQLTRDERQGMQDKALETSRENSKGRDAATLGSAAIREGAGNGQADPKLMTSLNQRLTQIRNVSSWTKLVEAEGNSEMLLHDVESGATPLQNHEAQVLAAKIIRGRVTDSEMRQLYDNIGGAKDAFSRLEHNTGLGELSPEQTRQLQQSTQVILNTHRMMVDRARAVARAGLDARSFSAMPEQAQAGYDMLLGELGMPSEPLPGAQVPAPAPAPNAAGRQPKANGAPKGAVTSRKRGGKTYYFDAQGKLLQ